MEAETVRAAPWLVRRARRPDAAVDLYCFPHLAGAPGEYARWSDDLPGVRVWALRPPGRGSRLRERPYTRMGALVDAIVSAVDFSPPFVFLGHSLGALVAYEVAAELRDRGRPYPDRLIVSACPAPSSIGPAPALHALPDRELLAEVERRWGPLPAEVRGDPELLAAALRGFRADLEVAETYAYRPRRPLDRPVTGLRGAGDTAAARMAAWGGHTTSEFDLHTFPGGHFYFRERRREVLDRVRTSLGGAG
ncbi:MAG TPA: alpha/beta fold hydrolase [Streptosporangiaceae bacterium]|jgi:surfactin synthase thioesterase subunit